MMNQVTARGGAGWRGAAILIFLIGLLTVSPGVARACGGDCGSQTGGCAGGFGCGCGCGAIGNNLDNRLGGANPSGSAAYDSYNVTLKGHLSMQQMALSGPGVMGSAIWGWHDPETGREYALYGKENGTAFVDVTDANNPRYLGDLPTQTGNSIWRELQTYGNYVYVVSDNNGEHGMQIFDLRRLRGVTTPQAFTADSVYNGGNYVINGETVNNKFDIAHTIYINSFVDDNGQQRGIAYLNGGGGIYNYSYHALSLDDPLTPTLVGGFKFGYVHDGQTVKYNGPDADYRGKQITMNSMGFDGLSVLEVTDAANPREIARRNYPFQGYTHQGWFTEDHRFFVVNDEFDEWWLSTGRRPTSTHLWDMADLDNPRYLGAFVHDTVAVDHNLTIKGNYVYMSNYSSGLRVYDLSRLGEVADGTRPVTDALELVGYFDTYFQDDSAPEVSFNGAWGNYPYLPSGNILVGDRNNGLFVVSLNSVNGPEPGSVALVLIGGAALWWRRASRRS
jgi:choice-of-anchor B domain-containing protein